MTRTHTHIDTPIGCLTAVAEDGKVVQVLFDGVAPVGTEPHDPSNPGANGPVLSQVISQLDDYFAGRCTAFDLPLAPRGTDFQHAAWEYLLTIPYGTTTTYGKQAVALGDANKSRAVGAANGKNPIPIIVPCHRVIGANGSLTGFAGGVDTKAWLLAHEAGQTMLDI